MAASMMAQLELGAMMQLGFNAPPMEVSIKQIPGLVAGLAQAYDMISLLEEQPELAAYMSPGGVPQEQQ